MALDDGHARVVLHGAEHRNVGVVTNHRAQLRLVARPAQLVEDYPGDANARIECLVAENERRNTARHATRVDHQYDRSADQRGERGVAVAAVEVKPSYSPLLPSTRPIAAPCMRRATSARISSAPLK